MINKKHMIKSLAALGFSISALSVATTHARAMDEISIVVFGPPSLGAFLPAVIKERGIDEEHDLKITFVERTPDAYTAQFNSGEFQVGGSAALLTVGIADARGVKAEYLFNIFDFWGGVVTSSDEVNSLTDLRGKDLAAAAGTTNYAMFSWFANSQGINPAEISITNTATPGLVGYAMAERATAIQLWEPAYTTLIAQKPGLKSIDLNIKQAWQAFAGSTNIPYLGVAAHQSWIEENQDLIPRLFAVYKDAAAWVVANPSEAAKAIAPKATSVVQDQLVEMIRQNDRLGLNLQWADDIRQEITKVYEAGTSIGYLPKMPSSDTIYNGGEK